MMYGVVEQIFSYLDYDSIVNAEEVSQEWQMILSNERIWKALLERNIASDEFWRKFWDWTKPSKNAIPGSDVLSSKHTCKKIGDLRRRILDTISLISSSKKILSKMIELVRLLGFNYPALEVSSSEED